MKLISNEALRGVDTSDLPLPFEIFKDFNDANTPDSSSLDLRITSSAPAITSTDNIVLEEGTTAFSLRDFIMNYGTCDANVLFVYENAAPTVTSMEGSMSGSTTTMDIASNATVFVEISPKNSASLATTTTPATATAILDREDTAIIPPLAAAPTGSAELPVAAPAHRFEEAGSAEELRVASFMLPDFDVKVERLLDTSHHDVEPPDPQPVNRPHDSTPGLEHHDTDQARLAPASSSRYWAAAKRTFAGLAVLLAVYKGIRLAKAEGGQLAMTRFLPPPVDGSRTLAIVGYPDADNCSARAGPFSPILSFYSGGDSGNTAELQAARSPPRRQSSDSTNASDDAGVILSPPRHGRRSGTKTPERTREHLQKGLYSHSKSPVARQAASLQRDRHLRQLEGLSPVASKPAASSPAGKQAPEHELERLRAVATRAKEAHDWYAEGAQEALAGHGKTFEEGEIYVAALEEALLAGEKRDLAYLASHKRTFACARPVSLEERTSTGPLSEEGILYVILNIALKLQRAAMATAEGIDDAFAACFNSFLDFDPSKIFVPAGAGLHRCVLAVGPQDIVAPPETLALESGIPRFGQPAYRDPMLAAIAQELLAGMQCSWQPWQLNLWTLGMISYRCASPGGCLPRGFTVGEVNGDPATAAAFYKAMFYASPGDTRTPAEATAEEVDSFSIGEDTKALIKDLLAVTTENVLWCALRVACCPGTHNTPLDFKRPAVSEVVSRAKQLLQELQQQGA